MFDVLGIAVGAEEGLALVVLHRQAADEVGQEHEGLALQLRVLVIVVVHVPGLVADHDVVVFLLHQVDEGHEVVHHDLVHGTQGEECGQVVFSRYVLEVSTFVGEPPGGRVHALAFEDQITGRGVDGEPVDVQVGLELAQFPGNREVPLHVAQADGTGDEQGLAPPAHGAHPGSAAGCAGDEVAHGAVEDDGVANAGQVPSATHREHPRVRHERVDLFALGIGHTLVAVAVDDQRRARDPAREVADVVADPAVAAPGDRLAGAGPAVPHAVLEGLGGMRLRE